MLINSAPHDNRVKYNIKDVFIKLEQVFDYMEREKVYLVHIRKSVRTIETLRRFGEIYEILYPYLGYLYDRYPTRFNPLFKEDTIQQMFFYMVGRGTSGTFYSLLCALRDKKYKTIYEVYLKCEDILRKAIYLNCRYLNEREYKHRVIKEDEIDDGFYFNILSNMKAKSPETIVEVLESRRNLVDFLLDTENDTKIRDGIDRKLLKKAIREYFKQFFTNGFHYLIGKCLKGVKLNGFQGFPTKIDQHTLAYAIYTIRRKIRESHVSYDDLFYKNELDPEIYPTFSQLLCDKLGIDYDELCES